MDTAKKVLVATLLVVCSLVLLAIAWTVARGPGEVILLTPEDEVTDAIQP